MRPSTPRLHSFWRAFVLVAALSSSGCLTLPAWFSSTQSEAPSAAAHPPAGIHVSCLKRPDPGPCKNGRPGYFYDYRTDRCRSFNYGGCEGRVPFTSIDACVKTCGGQPDPAAPRAAR